MVEDLHIQSVVERRDNDVVCLVPSGVGVVVYDLCSGQLLTTIQTQRCVRINSVAEVVTILQALRTMESHRNDTNSLVDRRTSQHLGDLNWEYLGRIHHRGQVAVDLLLDKSLQTRNEIDVEAEVVTTQGFADIVDGRSFQEAHLNTVDMRERDLQLDLQSHNAREGHILDNNVKSLADHGLADSNFEHNFGVDLAFELAGSHVVSVVGSETEFPVHHDNVILRLGIRFDMLHARGLGTQCESLELQTVQK